MSCGKTLTHRPTLVAVFVVKTPDFCTMICSTEPQTQSLYVEDTLLYNRTKNRRNTEECSYDNFNVLCGHPSPQSLTALNILYKNRSILDFLLDLRDSPHRI